MSARSHAGIDRHRAIQTLALMAALLGCLVNGAGGLAASNVTRVDVELQRASSTGGVRVSGQVTRQDTGTGVQGSLWLVSRTGGTDYADTDETGAYRFRGVPQGRYRLEVQTGGNLQDGWYRAGARGSFTNRASQATWLSVESSAIDGLVIALPLGATISGRVLGLGEMPDAVSVAAYRADEVGPKAEPVDYDMPFTSPRWRIDGLPPGRYVLRVESDQFTGETQSGCYRAGAPGSFTADCASASVIRLGTAGIRGIDITPPAGLRLRGRIEDRDGAPVCAHVTVRQVDAVLGQPDVADTAGCGTFRVDFLDAGRYEVHIVGADGVNIRNGYYAADAAGHWAAARADATPVVVAGRTRLPAIQPPAGTAVEGRLWSQAPGTDEISAVAIPVDARARSAWHWSVNVRSGYRITGLDPGRYRVAFVATAKGLISGCAWYSDATPSGTTWDRDAATVLAVGDATLADVNAEVPRGHSIVGKVTREDGSADVSGMVAVLPSPDLRPLLDVCVNGHVERWIEDGRWRVNGLPAGRYQVSIDTWNDGLRGGWYRLGAPGNLTPDRARASWIRVD